MKQNDRFPLNEITKGPDISETKFRLSKLSPFIAGIAFSTPVRETEELPTLGVDGETLFWNPKYWATLDRDQRLGAIAHEVLHLVFGHTWRRGHRDALAVDPTTGHSAMLFNLAADFAINLLLVEMLAKQGENPLDAKVRLTAPGWLYDRKYANLSAEEIYELLLKQMPQMTQKQIADMLKGNLECDKSHWDEKTGKELEGQKARMKNLTAMAKEMQKNSTRGTMPAFLKRLFEDMEQKEDWRQVLYDFVTKEQDDYTFERPDRRFLDHDFYLPEVKENDKIDYLVVAVDTSGSIGDKELSSFLGELKGMFAAFDKVKIKLTFCDADASPFTELDSFDPALIQVTGGGGTSFVPPFELVKKEESQPKAMIYFTDGYGDFPLPSEYPAIWIMTTNEIAPFGRTLPYKI